MALPEEPVGDYMDGRVVVSLADGLWEFTEQCPYQGTDPNRINDWYDLMRELSGYLVRLCDWCCWPEGMALAETLSAHADSDPPRIEATGATELAWFDELMVRAGAVARAARCRWQEREEDEDDEEDGE